MEEERASLHHQQQQRAWQQQQQQQQQQQRPQGDVTDMHPYTATAAAAFAAYNFHQQQQQHQQQQEQRQSSGGNVLPAAAAAALGVGSSGSMILPTSSSHVDGGGNCFAHHALSEDQRRYQQQQQQIHQLQSLLKDSSCSSNSNSNNQHGNPCGLSLASQHPHSMLLSSPAGHHHPGNMHTHGQPSIPLSPPPPSLHSHSLSSSSSSDSLHHAHGMTSLGPMAPPPLVTPKQRQHYLKRALETFTKEHLVALLCDIANNLGGPIFDEAYDRSCMDLANRKVFVRGIAWGTTNDSLGEALSVFGPIQEAAVICDRATGKSKGYAFVTFDHGESAFRLLDLPFITIDGRNVQCFLASQRGAGTTGGGGGGEVHPAQHTHAPSSAPHHHYVGGGRGEQNVHGSHHHHHQQQHYPPHHHRHHQLPPQQLQQHHQHHQRQYSHPQIAHSPSLAPSTTPSSASSMSPSLSSSSSSTAATAAILATAAQAAAVREAGSTLPGGHTGGRALPPRAPLASTATGEGKGNEGVGDSTESSVATAIVAPSESRRKSFPGPDLTQLRGGRHGVIGVPPSLPRGGGEGGNLTNISPSSSSSSVSSAVSSSHSFSSSPGPQDLNSTAGNTSSTSTTGSASTTSSFNSSKHLRQVLVRGMALDASHDVLRGLFHGEGEVEDAFFLSDPSTRAPIGAALVTFREPRVASLVLRTPYRDLPEGRVCEILAVPPPASLQSSFSPSSLGGGGGGGGEEEGGGECLAVLGQQLQAPSFGTPQPAAGFYNVEGGKGSGWRQ
ncbi:Hypothetical protein NocV09_01900490 [Nannochloropsis oceanica]